MHDDRDDRKGGIPHAPSRGTETPGPDFRWGGYDEGDRKLDSGYVTEGGYGPYLTPDAAEPGPHEHPARGGALRPDGELEAEIREALSADGRVSDHHIAAKVEEGAVILHGEVPLQVTRQIAGKLVAEIEGVHAVANRIRVDDGPDS